MEQHIPHCPVLRSCRNRVLYRSSGGRSYAEVLVDLKTKANSEQTGTVVKSVRHTQNGDSLLELGKSEDKAAFNDIFKSALGEKGSIQALLKIVGEIWDHVRLSTEFEVNEGIRKAVPELGAKSAVDSGAELSYKIASKPLSHQHIKAQSVAEYNTGSQTKYFKRLSQIS
ncbi:hypothetical protein J6590_085729 [Homalodisca vitripennis]|nr:hypothetical protein J6590_085729 [Homalodisca vitripennis]